MLNRFFRSFFQTTRQDNYIVLPSLPLVALCIGKTISLSYCHVLCLTILDLGKTILNCLTETILFFVLLCHLYIQSLRQSSKTIHIVLLTTSSSPLLYTRLYTYTCIDLYWVFKFRPKTCWDSWFSSFHACWLLDFLRLQSNLCRIFGKKSNWFRRILCWAIDFV